MPTYVTRLTNSDFDAIDHGTFHATDEDAAKAALLAAADVGKELLASGERLSRIDILVRQGERLVAKRRLTLSVDTCDEDEDQLIKEISLHA